MSKYKILLTGKNKAIIDDFFNHLSIDFALLTTSLRFADMDDHLDLYKPDIMVICLSGESREHMQRFNELKRKLNRYETTLVVIGEQEEIDAFQTATVYMANLTIPKPVTPAGIKEAIDKYMMELQQEKEQEALLEKEKAAAEAAERANERKRVLVIDDEPIMLKMIQEILCDKYDVATAISGKIAYKFLEKKKTDLILLDYQMPVENGPEVMENIRSNSNYDNIPIIFLTGVTDKDSIKEVLKLKPNGYILKPIDNDKLREAIGRLIG